MTSFPREIDPTLGRSPSCWRAWLSLWAVVLVCQIVLLMNNAALDTFLWRTTRWFTGDQNSYKWADYKADHAGDPAAPFYQRTNPPMTRTTAGVTEARFYKRTETIWRVLRDLGEPVTTLLVIGIVWSYHPRGRHAAMLVIIATASTGGLGWLIRAIAGRYRPIVGDGANVWHLFRGFGETQNLSWPSGHSTLALATAAALVYLAPKGRWLLVPIALGCAATRVVMQAHFWSDVVFGAALGWTGGWFAVTLADRFLCRRGMAEPHPVSSSTN